MRAILAVLLVLPTIVVAVVALLAVLPTTSMSTSGTHATADAVDYREDGDGGADLLAWRHGNGEAVVEVSAESEAPPFTSSMATSLPDTNRHLAASSDRHNVAVWAHKDALLYSYNNHTFTAHRNTGSNSDQVGQWRHIRGATKPDGPNGTETIIVGISKDEKWVRGMLLQDGATAWTQIVPVTKSTGVLATLSFNQYAAVDVQYESISQNALLVWSTDEDATVTASGMAYSVKQSGSLLWSEPAPVPSLGLAINKKIYHLVLAADPSSNEMILVASTENKEEFAMVWSGSSWGNPILLHGKADGDSHTDINVVYEKSSTYDGLVVFASASLDLQYTLWRNGAWSSRKLVDDEDWGFSTTTAIAAVTPPDGVSGCKIAFTDVTADPASDNILIGVTCGIYGWTIRWIFPPPGGEEQPWGFDNKILHANDLVTNDCRALSVAYEGASKQALVVFSRENLKNVYHRRLDGPTGSELTPTHTNGLSTDCPATSLGGCQGPQLDNVPNTVRLSTDLATQDIALMVQDDGDDIYFVRFDGRYNENIFGTPYKLDTDSDASKKNEPMLFLWGGAGSAAGNAFWAHKDVYYPNYMEYDSALNALNANNTGLVKQSPGVGQWKIIQGAVSPISDETIVVGIAKDGDKEIRGKVLRDSSISFWEGISVPTGTPDIETTLLNNQLKSTDYWSIDVKYESLSGQSLIVWSNGVAASASTSGISFTSGTGQSDNVWTQPENLPPVTTGSTYVTLAEAKVKQVRMASNPKSNEIMLIASNANNQKFAVVWSGSAWADANLLADGDGDSSNFFTDVNVAYEAQNGNGFAVFGDLSPAANGVKSGQMLRYASFNGAASNNKWDNIKTMNPGNLNPSAALTTASTVRWTRIASDRKSDRIIVGVLTDDKKIWTAIWDGAASGTNVWESESVEIHTADAKYNDRPQFSVAFESLSQNAMIVYSVSDTDALTLQSL
jgi:hypothetical protein